MYNIKEKCREASVEQLIKRKALLIKRMNGLMTFVMGSITNGRYSKCGKKSCSCHDKIKPKLHGPYSDLSHRGGDKVGSIFLTTEKAPIAEKLIKEYEELWTILKEISCINLELFRRKEFEYLNS